MWTGDNLDILRGLNSESIDLVYADPPFNSNKNYEAPIGSEAAGAAFKDTWTLNDVNLAEHGEIADREPKVYAAIDTAGIVHGKAMKSYLIMMAVRLLELRRVLKPTGSLYLHCDDTADAYLRLLCDAVFGAQQMRNAISWKRQTSNNATTGRCGRIVDTLLFYVRTSAATWNGGRHALSDRELREYKQTPDGRLYKCDNLTAPGGSRGFTWRGATPPPSRGWAFTEEVLERMLAAGEIELKANGTAKMRGRVRWLADNEGQKLQNLWTDIQRVGNTARERTGYPTQKPLALLDRIIKASSNPGDVVLDPFCGCATACVSAETLDRQWIGIDLSPVAAELVEQRLRHSFEVTYPARAIHHRKDVPRRTDLGELPNYRTHKHTLYGKQEGLCGGCRHHFLFRNFEGDHLIARAKGGSDHLDNLQLLCGACNRAKGTGTQAELIAKLRERGQLAA